MSGFSETASAEWVRRWLYNNVEWAASSKFIPAWRCREIRRLYWSRAIDDQLGHAIAPKTGAMDVKRSSPRELHVVVTTHTTRHLRRVLLGVAWQAEPADSVTVACDNDRPEIGELLGEVVREVGMPVRYVRRPFTGRARAPQTRNNGVRALLEDGADPRSLLVFLDGDTVPAHNALVRYREVAGGGELIIGDRIRVSEEDLQRFDERALQEGREPIPGILDRSLPALRRRRRRCRRQKVAFFLPWAKPEKPRLLGANHAVWLDALQSVNGFDERFEGWGKEDKDLGRRIYGSGGRPVIAVTEAVAYHLPHPERPRADDDARRSLSMFEGPFTVRCEYGLDNPKAQPAIRVSWVAPERRSDERAVVRS